MERESIVSINNCNTISPIDIINKRNYETISHKPIQNYQTK